MAHTSEKILIINRDLGFSESLARTLREHNYIPLAARNADEGVKLMYDSLPHLIVLDADMPGTSGYDILEKKQMEPMLSRVPVFLLSTQGSPFDMQKIPQGSVTEFLMALHSTPNDILEKINARLRPVAQAAAPAPRATNGKKKILWVEDDKLIGTILSKKIISSGFELFHAKNGEEAMAIVAKETPDAIVVDLLLPGMSGFDILQRMQMDERSKKIPTMVLSNLSKPSDIEKAKTLGAKKFLVKAATSLDQIVVEMKDLSK